jgi:N utilization substance protein B
MRGRTLAREVALQLAYQLDLRGEEVLAEVEEFIRAVRCGPGPAAYARRLAEGVWEHRAEIDARIAEASANWAVDRIAAIDRSILRLATFEMMHVPDTPPKVVLNEAVELARRFGGEDSPRFVNGVLDQIAAAVRGERAE